MKHLISNIVAKVWPYSWYECPLCKHKVKLHKADVKIGCIKDNCPNIGLVLNRSKFWKI